MDYGVKVDSFVPGKIKMTTEYNKLKEKARGAKQGLSPGKLGTDSLYRVVYLTHLNLSHMADRKAHFMIGMNMFVLSLIVSKRHAGPLMQLHGYLIPNILLVLLCTSCIVLSILATRPALIKPSLKAPEDVNWMFFANFSQYPFEIFKEQTALLWHNERRLYDSMSEDIYWLGRSLEGKYRYLKWCYTVFYYGLITVSLAFLIAFVLHKMY